MTVEPIITRSVSSELYRRVTIDCDHVDSWHHETVYEEVEPDTRLRAIADAWNGESIAPVKAWAYEYLPELAGLLDALTEEEGYFFLAGTGLEEGNE